jgi:predicted O-methyltransferase YrrM
MTTRSQAPAAFDVDAPVPPRTDESSSLPAATAARQGYLVTVDSSGPWPALCVSDRIGGATVALNGRRNPVLDAERALAAVLRGDRPPVVVLIGLGLGYVLEALERQNSDARVIAFEPLPDAISAFHARRDWSAWLDSGRLTIVEGPEYLNAAEAWAALAPAQVPPVVVGPALARACPDLVAGARGAIVRAQFGTVLDPRVAEAKQSMLHEKVLVMLEHTAASVSGAIVEIGAHVGGGTIAMTRGIRDAGRDTLMMTIEPGGAYPTHPHLPSNDIFGDLQENLRKRGLQPYVALLHGKSDDPDVLESVRTRLAERQLTIGLLCIDADGEVERDLNLYLPLCAPGCRLVIDDYSGPPENWKVGSTKRDVDALVASGNASELGVFGWGTWFGVYTPKTAV